MGSVCPLLTCTAPHFTLNEVVCFVFLWVAQCCKDRRKQGVNMPFLHGFRRIIYEYQPLVDEILRVLGIEEGAGAQGR